MTLLQLQYFRELGKTLHYTKAAEHLHISQPGLSYSISELEKELGSKLFEKKNRKFQLTPAGQVFMQYVEQALAKPVCPRSAGCYSFSGSCSTSSATWSQPL